MKALLRRAEAHEKLDHFEEALVGKVYNSYWTVQLSMCTILSCLLKRPCFLVLNSILFPFCFNILSHSFCLLDMKKILELDPTNEQAKKSIRRLEPLAEEKREKMKEEMIGKLMNCFFCTLSFILLGFNHTKLWHYSGDWLYILVDKHL